jgi:Arc/MetJ family transcription regulator
VEALMSESLIDLDGEALTAAAALYGTNSATETVNTALREVAARHRRVRALAELVEVAETGQFDEVLDQQQPGPASARTAAERRLTAFDRLGEMAEAGELDVLLVKRNYRR